MTWLAAAAMLLAIAAFSYATVSQRRARENAARLESASRALEQLQRAFSRFAPATVVEQIIERGLSATAEKREVTVLFADLQGFTSLSERLDPVSLVEILNGYFARMSRAIRDHHGHVSKFMGDGLMALFGALEKNPWDARDAVEAALEMRAALQSYNVELERRGLPALSFGVGIHRGTAVAGIVGSEQLLEFTVIGDTVNTAARVESLTRRQGTAILITDAVSERLRGRFALRAMPACEVKGKAEPLLTFAVDGPAEVTSAAEQRRAL
ncbi:MAG TPA: adenylate/guanylate cyclase domain-containing protein [Polyangiaceae bacterium]|jgi:adenylate cyclase|nr:adenylate/guanylate cyclase domain-containing protein [Polyangiaceae bacterium]